MFLAITKLSKDSQQFVTSVSTLNGGRSLLTSLVVAKILSVDALLPSSALATAEDLMKFYETQVQYPIQDKLLKLNELVILDKVTVLDLALKFYKQRYYAAHPLNRVLCLDPATAVTDFFGISAQFDPATLSVISKDPVGVSTSYRKFATLIEEVFCGERDDTVKLSDQGTANEPQ